MQLTIFYAEDDFSLLQKYKSRFLKTMSMTEYNKRLLELQIYILYKRIYNMNVKEEI